MATTTKKAVKKTGKKVVKKTTTKKTVAKGKGKTNRSKGNGELSGNQVKILQALKGGRSMSRSQLAEKTGINKGFSKLLGASTKGASPESLEGRKLVRSEKFEDQRELQYTITATGKKVIS